MLDRMRIKNETLLALFERQISIAVKKLETKCDIAIIFDFKMVNRKLIDELNCFLGKNYFKNEGFEIYLIFQSLFKTLKLHIDYMKIIRFICMFIKPLDMTLRPEVKY